MCRADRITDVKTPTGVFWVINGSDGDLVWRRNFNRVIISIDGEADDFNNTNYKAFHVSGLLFHAFSG